MVDTGIFFLRVCCFVERKDGRLDEGIEKWGWGFRIHRSSLILSNFSSIISN